MEIKLKQAEQPISDAWQQLAVAPRHSTLLGISFRPLQAKAFNLDIYQTLDELLAYPFQVIRLGAYWKQIEPAQGVFQAGDLDRQIEAAEKAGKQIILCTGPIKTFGYPEFFVPKQYLHQAFPEGKRIHPNAFAALMEAATAHLIHLVERYKPCKSIIAWQLEHEAVDPLGVEHSWRLDVSWVKREIEALRKADPTRPVILNGFLPTSLPVRLSQWWRTRDQGDSLAAAQSQADWIGIDYYPRNALFNSGKRSLYLDGSKSRWLEKKRRWWLEWSHSQQKQLLVVEGQAEPWEAVTTPPNPKNYGMYSCLPEHIISNYNDWMDLQGPQKPVFAYLFWGAEYWMLRKQGGDAGYLGAFQRILES
jgi:hypothetical protein